MGRSTVPSSSATWRERYSPRPLVLALLNPRHREIADLNPTITSRWGLEATAVETDPEAAGCSVEPSPSTNPTANPPSSSFAPAPPPGATPRTGPRPPSTAPTAPAPRLRRGPRPRAPTDHVSFALGVALGRFAPPAPRRKASDPRPVSEGGADLSHALPAGILLLDRTSPDALDDDLGHPACAPSAPPGTPTGPASTPAARTSATTSPSTSSAASTAACTTTAPSTGRCRHRTRPSWPG